MRCILNVIWLVFGGFFLAIGYLLAAVICFILIITIPFGIASLRMALFEEPGVVAGVANLTNITGSPGFRATLGYSLAERCQGKGLMREALKAILPAAVARFRLHRVEAAYLPRNERSGRLLESLGFEKEGLAREYLLIDGRWEDHILTAWRDPDWR